MPTISILTATGTQGSSVLEAVLADGKYTPRAITRNVDSAASQALIARGVEVVAGNLWDKESVKKAIRGSDAVFGNVNFWDPEIYNPGDSLLSHGKGELVQGKNLVDAAKEEGIKFFIWSTLPSATKESNGLYTHVYHLDNKVVTEEYLKESGVPYACLSTGWFLENLWKIGSLTKDETGNYIVPIPKYGPEDTQSGTWVAHELGQAAVALLNNCTDPSMGVLGKNYPVVTAKFTYPEFTAALSKAIGKEVTFISPPTAGTEELDEMFSYQAKIGMYNDTPIPNPDLVALGVKFATLEEFIQAEVVHRFK
ncbi:NAD(P)-binding protein [Roridomyces roridus]|uniref:NAD(P)-binding protein n=1 Tax=Roridomyces roridus TaxID=1738132 RepID=A0AAD7BD63_9AGAR|nr:NAD(P)-binding protein [Roridomyces roridus]